MFITENQANFPNGLNNFNKSFSNLNEKNNELMT